MKKEKKGMIKLLAFVFFMLVIPLFFLFSNSNENKTSEQIVAFAVNESKSNFNENGNVISALAEDYKNPNFYPTYEQYKNKKPPEDRIGIWGLGIYPSRQEHNAKKDDEITVTAYLHTSWFVQTYQGVQLEADYDKRYFDVSISPNVVLLGPSYPSFNEQWAHKITVKIKAKDVPKGAYHIAINPAPPPFEKEEEWRASHKNYVSAAPIIPEEPYLKITVDVK